MEHQLEMPAVEKKRQFKFGRRHLVMMGAVLLVAVALVLNFVLFGGDKITDPTDLPTGENAEGEANAPTTSVDGYFSAAQVNRQRARDEALEVLQSVVENENATEATKTEALLEISSLAREMEAEANIEAMVLAKGFEQCVAIVNGDTCSVIVNGTELAPAQISQINEIVYEQAGILPANIRIVTK